MAMKVKEVARLVGISVRTLHHYDEIGLLSPDEVTDAGYRLYSEQNLDTLQQILFFRELGFPLKKIKEIINRPSFNRQEALEIQRNMLLKKRRQLDQMIATIEKTIQHLKGEVHMSNKEKFTGFDFNHHPYEKEARERWGDDVIDQSQSTIGKMTKVEQEEMTKKMHLIYEELAELRHQSPDSRVAQAAIQKWYDFLNNHFGHHYSLDAFKGLGEMYVADERFTKNIDQYGEGLASFMCKAMAIFAENNQK